MVFVLLGAAVVGALAALNSDTDDETTDLQRTLQAVHEEGDGYSSKIAIYTYEEALTSDEVRVVTNCPTCVPVRNAAAGRVQTLRQLNQQR